MAPVTASGGSSMSSPKDNLNGAQATPPAAEPDLHQVEASAAVDNPRARRSPALRAVRSVLYSLTLPFALLVGWALWATGGASPFFPAPQKIFTAFIDTWVGPAFVTDVLPSLARLGLGILA